MHTSEYAVCIECLCALCWFHFVNIFNFSSSTYFKTFGIYVKNKKFYEYNIYS